MGLFICTQSLLVFPSLVMQVGDDHQWIAKKKKNDNNDGAPPGAAMDGQLYVMSNMDKTQPLIYTL